ncbi:IclR family transcriptional regulator [Natrinema gelatinilyticum]|uniref:IclR family transcriptional regulator n=1 Tax=Natrinema gelatinilyticum TaxID=2961571 RepID=UPI0020C374C6|nr:IclR family transcriptional regulator [Natrinema gelatinilyticum]
MPEDAKHPVKTVRKAFEIVDYLKSNDSARLSELTTEFEMSKSAIHNHLSTLVEAGYVKKHDGEYRLSLRFLDVGGYLRKQMELYQVAKPETDALAEQTGELANLMTEEFGQGVYLYRAKGDLAVDLDTYVGRRCYLHNTALGKAILAYLPASRVDEIVDTHGLPAETDHSITSRSELDEELEVVHERGFALDNEERLEGLRCIAAPIRDESGAVLGAISVSGPTTRMNAQRFEDEIPDLVCSAANVIELNVKY